MGDYRSAERKVGAGVADGPAVEDLLLTGRGEIEGTITAGMTEFLEDGAHVGWRGESQMRVHGRTPDIPLIKQLGKLSLPS